ncbi:TonB-dependent siderophore receptor [Polycladidibacter hongkongensis]|uniref:TonB-dependent siderophore receptor n=1 Tax=Polycladidibacter hongkongensis TaxID=1647556 RepID=UPI0008364175|nr:TonB-dependent siderophore receptor [Pseudovibrio hongkongensis]
MRSVSLLLSSAVSAVVFSAVPSLAQQVEVKLDPVILKAPTAEEIANSPTEGYVAGVSATAGRTALHVAETPRSVSVITSEQIADQGAGSLEEAISYTAGVTTATYGYDGRYDEFAIRGFVTEIGGNYRDGLPLRTFGWSGWRSEPFAMERAEVLRGPTSDVYGANQPGGLVNSVSKRPRDEFAAEAFVAYGEHNQKRLGVDVTGPLGAGSPFTYRLVGVLQDADTRYKGTEDDSLYFAPSVSAKLGEHTKLTVLGQLKRDEIGETYQVLPMSGTLKSNALGQISRDTLASHPDHNNIVMNQNSVGYEFEHEFDIGLRLLQRARYAHHRLDYNGSYNAGGFASASLLRRAGPIDRMLLQKFNVNQISQQASVDTAAEYTFQFDAGETRALLGTDFFWGNSKAGYAMGYLGEMNPFTGEITNLLAADPRMRTHLPAYLNQRMSQIGVYAVADTVLYDKWNIAANLRYDKTTVKSHSQAPVPAVVQQSESRNSAVTARLGLSYQFDFGLTPYASFGTSFNAPPAGAYVDGSMLKPETSRQFEVGLKYSPDTFDGLFTLAGYEITKSNVTESDPANRGFFVQTGEVRVRGLEFEAVAELGYGFSTIASYSYQQAKITKDAQYTGNRMVRIPEHTASVWLKHDFQQEALEGLSFAAGYRFTGERFSDKANKIKLPSVGLFDASLNYEVNNLKFSLTGRNLANKTYVASCADAGAARIDPRLFESTNCTYGKGRELRLQMSAKF